MAIAVLEGFFKKAKKKLKSAVKKVANVVKSPVFLKLAAVGSAFIPAVGPVVSRALDKVSGMVAQRQVVKEEIKAQKRQQEIQQNAAVEAAAYAQAVATASGSPEAMQNVSGLISALSSGQQQQVQQIAPSMAQQMQQLPSGQAFESSVKGFGQAMAMNRLAAGSGADTVPEMSELDKAAQGNPVLAAAIQQGIADLLNSAALSGDVGTFESAIDQGTPSTFPWTPILITTGVVVVAGGIALVATR